MIKSILVMSFSSLFLQVIDPGIVLYSLLFLLMGGSFVLLLFLRRGEKVTKPLLVLLPIMIVLLVAILVLDVFGLSGPAYTYGEISRLSSILSTHRWLLMQFPLLLLTGAFIVLSVYRDEIVDSHAREYRGFFLLSVLLSFLAILSLAFESLI